MRKTFTEEEEKKRLEQEVEKIHNLIEKDKES